MESGRMMLRLGLAALVSGAAAGMLATVAVFLDELFFRSAERWWTLSILADWLPIGLLAGLVIGSLPAFFAGASMWTLGHDFEAARHPLAWAVAGAAVGGALWGLFVLLLAGPGAGARFDLLLAASLVAGAGGALAFLGAMRLGGSRFRRAPRRRR